MKKRLVPMLCAALLCVIAFTVPALAAEQTVRYPISVEEYTEGGIPHIKKVYQLSLNEDPAVIPTGDFERFGYVYHLLDITQHNDEGVDVKDYTDTITQDSDTGELSVVLKQLDGQREITTENGYTGLLVLDHTSIEITVKGYNTSTRNLSACRTYPNLSDADLSLVPKTVNENGKTLSLNDVQWATEYQEDGSARYTATASYTGTSTSRYATGYTVTANYVGRVSKTGCGMITYELGEKTAKILMKYMNMDDRYLLNDCKTLELSIKDIRGGWNNAIVRPARIGDILDLAIEICSGCIDYLAHESDDDEDRIPSLLKCGYEMRMMRAERRKYMKTLQPAIA